MNIQFFLMCQDLIKCYWKGIDKGDHLALVFRGHDDFSDSHPGKYLEGIKL